MRRSVFSLLRFVVRGLVILAPWIVRAFIAMVLMSLTTFSVWCRGVDAGVTAIANSLRERLINAHLIIEYDSVMYWVLKTMAYFYFVLGWIVASFFTVTVLRLLLSV